MAVYVVTGKLGGGKSLACIDRINTAISQGRRVATNLDLRIDKLPSCTRHTKSAQILRVPDKPTHSDLDAIGYGIAGVTNDSEALARYDESKFGLLVLDECGTWFNSRDWQESGRRELINLLLHIRKRLWDVYLIIQDISMLDKQARKSLAEHVVYCRRTDRMNIPIFGALFKTFTGERLPVPKWHIAHVKYGDQQHSLTVDRWMYNGSSLYDAYDTTQVFSDDYSDGVYTLLPPWYHYRRTFTQWNLKNIMRLTHIYLRKYSLISLSSAFFTMGALFAFIFLPHSNTETIDQTINSEQIAITPDSSPIIAASQKSQNRPTVYDFKILSSAEYVTENGIIAEYTFSDGQREYDSNQLRGYGYKVEPLNSCTVRLTLNDDITTVRC